MQFVSHVFASCGRGDLSEEGKTAVLRLRQAIVQIGTVQHLQDAKAEVWNALPEAVKLWTISAACCGYFTSWPGLSPLTTEKIKDRGARLKSLGNSVVPAQAYPFFEAIAKVAHR